MKNADGDGGFAAEGIADGIFHVIACGALGASYESKGGQIAHQRGLAARLVLCRVPPQGSPVLLVLPFGVAGDLCGRDHQQTSQPCNDTNPKPPHA